MSFLSAYDLPEYYDWTSTGLDHDIQFYVSLAKNTGGPVIELGCGTGRVSLALAREGIEVIGIDFSPEMLGKAKEKAREMGLQDRIKWVEASMTHFSIPGQHSSPLVIIPYRSFLHLLTIKDQINTLKCIRRSLGKEGKLALNVFVPHIDQLHEMEDKYAFRGVFPIPGTQDEVEIYDYTELDTFGQIARITRYMERFNARGTSIERIKTQLTLRYIFPTELSHLLAVCGFKILHRYGTFHKDPFDHKSEELIIEAIKVGNR